MIMNKQEQEIKRLTKQIDEDNKIISRYVYENKHLKKEIEKLSDKLGNELQVKILRNEKLKDSIKDLQNGYKELEKVSINQFQKLENIEKLMFDINYDPENCYSTCKLIKEILGDKNE